MRRPGRRGVAAGEPRAWLLLRELLAGQPFAVLATQGDGAPHASLVCFATTPDLRWIHFPTRAGTRKFGHLSACPRVALLMDNRSNQSCDLRQAVAVTVAGEVRPEPGAGAGDGLALLQARHPDLAEFLAQPDCRIAAVRVMEYALVTRFERVTRLDPARRAG